MLHRLSVLLLVALAATPTCAEEQGDYMRKIKPLLALRCTTCHGAVRQEGGLRLDAGVMIHKGGDSGAALVVGKPDKSLFIDALTGRDGVSKMPQDASPLKPEEIALLTEWVKHGAKYPKNEPIAEDPRDHWAFQVPKRPPVPRPKNARVVANPIDAFLQAARERRQLVPQQPAPKHILLRRVHLDVVGLPPTPEEIRAFAAADSADAYGAVVDQLLKSPRYGERWGRHWMDVWRYSDWYGYKKELRSSQRHIWRWRDWIIESLNEDKPYDRMIVEMLAADEVAPTDRNALRATGFLARNYYKFNRHVWLDSQIEHTAKAFLGITMNCARCHSHMYDPISHTEYYQFRAIFEPYQVRVDRVPGQANIATDGLAIAYDAKLSVPTYIFERGNDKTPLKDNPVTAGVPPILSKAKFNVQPVQLPAVAYYPGLRPHIRQEERAKVQAAIKAKQAALDKARKQNRSAEFLAAAEKQLVAAKTTLLALEARIVADDAKYATPPNNKATQLAQQAAQREREAALRTAEATATQAESAVTIAKGKLDAKNAKTKQALTAAEKQLAAARKTLTTAQAAIKKTDGNYKPLSAVYPKTSTGRRLALARWIVDRQNPLTARVAVNHIWMRHFGEPLVPTVFEFGLNGKPASHPQLLDWLVVEFIESGWSMKHLHRLILTSNAYRMHSATTGVPTATIEADRDNHFLWRMNSRRMESEIVRDSVLAVAGSLDLKMGGPDLDGVAGQTTFRRSVYYRHAPEKFMTFLDLFDTASTHECYRRNETVVPQQALALANSRLSLEQSRRLSAHLNKQSGTGEASTNAYIIALFQRVLCRPPSNNEATACQQFLVAQTKRLTSPAGLTRFGGTAKLTVPASADPRLRARENLAHVLLNHNEFITVR